jgi:hypothetical protein
MNFRGWLQQALHWLVYLMTRSAVEEVAADLGARRLEQQRRRVLDAFEALDFANKLPTGGESEQEKRRILEAFRVQVANDAVLDAGEFPDLAPSGPAEEPEQAVPTGPGGSAPPGTSLPGWPQPPALSNPVPQTSSDPGAPADGNTAQALPRRRGRPKGSRNKKSPQGAE